jgi:predicted enzyme related to lactoylglutathione lyase
MTGREWTRNISMPASTLRDICFDCADQHRVARFWAEVLGYRLGSATDPEEPVALEPPGGGVRIWFNPVPEPKVGKNRVHIDVNLPDEAEMERLRSLGARVLREIRGEDGALWWTIMADPEGNEFCAFLPQ